MALNGQERIADERTIALTSCRRHGEATKALQQAALLLLDILAQQAARGGKAGLVHRRRRRTSSHGRARRPYPVVSFPARPLPAAHREAGTSNNQRRLSRPPPTPRFLCLYQFIIITGIQSLRQALA